MTIEYSDLASGSVDLTEQIETAYGYDGIGLLAVRNVPGYEKKRQALLPLARQLAHLPQADLDALEDEPSFYSVGWSHGKEKFLGKPDFSKGSFYANPLMDVVETDADLIKKYPAFLAPNLWPNQSLPGLEPAFKDLGQLIVDVGRLVARHCDHLVHSRLPTYPEHKLEDLLHTSRTPKGRLLYYFPKETAGSGGAKQDIEQELGSWCGWHNDHGSLTGLATAMYFDAEGQQVPCPDPGAGLHVRSRNGDVLHVKPPADCMAFQIGESAQIHSAGMLQATPHAVKAADVPGIGRATLAVFMEPEWHEPMNVPDGADASRVLRGARGELLPPGVPPLQGRWEPTQDFGLFSEKTFGQYY